MINLVKKFKNRFFLNLDDSLIIEENKKAHVSTFTGPKKNILIQMPEDYYYLALFSVIVNFLKESFTLNLSWINLNCEFQRRNLVKRNRLFERKWTKLYLSLGGRVGLSHLLYNKKDFKSYQELAKVALASVKSKSELIGLKYNNILIGDLVYDTYLRYKPAPTVDLSDIFLRDIVSSALYITDNTTRYLDQNPVDLLITSYCCYIQHGIPVRLAHAKNIKVISFGSHSEIIKTVNKNYPSHVREYFDYKNTFDNLDASVAETAKKRAQDTLEFRLSGGIDFATSYMRKSAYIVNDKKHLQDSNDKPRIIFFLHCFFDSPHIYRNMVFPDFYEWLDQSLDYLKNKEYYVYLKPHPNGLNGNQEIVNQILKKYPYVKVLPPEANNKSLAMEGFEAAVTIYGTLIHEFTYLGIPVISCGDNPHISYKFGLPAKDVREYFEKLDNVSKAKPKTESNKDDVLSFVYMHSFYKNSDSIPEVEQKDLIASLQKCVNSKNTYEFIKETNRLGRYATFKKKIKSVVSS